MDARRIEQLKALADTPPLLLPPESVVTIRFINTQVAAVLGSDESLSDLQRLNVPPTRGAIISYGLIHETRAAARALPAHVAAASIGRLILNHN